MLPRPLGVMGSLDLVVSGTIVEGIKWMEVLT